ncbi:GNAT family N-acetyltransferase [Hamadaea sp. NPDC050747]|uniref:GNAT family N-acetyltransferase n=1 Tax=Hamadaea sp. NPDC050747 TaxID=3155789 RepID=UPI0033F91C48
MSFEVRHVDPVGDAELLHGWVTHPKAAFWMMRHASLGDVAAEYAAIAARPGHDALIGSRDGVPVFLMERYDPRHELAGAYPVRPGDVGMHFLVAPAETPIPGFTRAVILAVLDLLFADPLTHRVVVEPDARNTAVHTLNAYAGFEIAEKVRLPHKEALLSFCTRAAFEHAQRRSRHVH